MLVQRAGITGSLNRTILGLLICTISTIIIAITSPDLLYTFTIPASHLWWFTLIRSCKQEKTTQCKLQSPENMISFFVPDTLILTDTVPLITIVSTVILTITEQSSAHTSTITTRKLVRSAAGRPGGLRSTVDYKFTRG